MTTEEELRTAAQLALGKDPGAKVVRRSAAGLAAPRDRAKQVALEMLAATTELNRTIEAAEKDFAELNLGVSASVRFPDEDDPEGHYACSLQFGKDGRAWRLMVVTYDGRDDDGHESPLLSCSRETRVNSLKVLPSLFVELVEEAERQAKELREQVTAGREAIAQVLGIR